MFSGNDLLRSWNCLTVKPSYLMAATRKQFSRLVLTVSTVCSFLVREMAALMWVGLEEGVRLDRGK